MMHTVRYAYRHVTPFGIRITVTMFIRVTGHFYMMRRLLQNRPRPNNLRADGDSYALHSKHVSPLGEVLVAHTYMVDALVHDDGIMTVTSDEIDGLVLEVDSLGRLSTELRALAPELLKANHGLSDEAAKAAQYQVRFDVKQEPVRDYRVQTTDRHAPMGLVYA